ncbi:MAG TPA: hypothetical protein VK563_19370 [Puia sp.]|nr:hypothetical protein [Puia sp.]
MSILKIYKWVWLPALLLALSGCGLGNQKKLDRRLTLWRKDKIPYGDYIAFENLKYIFPDAEITINKNSPAQFDHLIEGKKAYLIIVPLMGPDEPEWRAIMNFVGDGNQVFISSSWFGDTVQRSLNFKQANDDFFQMKDSLQVSLHNPVTRDSLSFVYPGDPYDAYAHSLDSQYTTILGRDKKGRPNFMKFGYKGGGAIYLQLAPMAFTNFFLLHKDNIGYYENALSYIPASVKEVKWDDYFRYGRAKDFSAFQFILANRSLKWALGLLLLLFLLIYLFESKRKQRMIPQISALRNNSLDFVKTIGRLYYQRRDNLNLALKIVAHFQDHIRSRYNMPASSLDDQFLDRLSYKSGFDKERLLALATDIKNLQERTSLTDEELLGFNKKMEEFYKQV